MTIAETLIKGDSFGVKQLIEQALEGGIAPEDIIKESLIPGMETVSVKFQSGEFYVMDVITAADAMQTGIKILKERSRGERILDFHGRIVIGTVEGDIHDLGKNIVALTLEGAGYEVIDLGVNVSPAQFVEAIAKFHPDLVCISALLTVTMCNIEDVIKAIKEAGFREQVKIIIGGAPITQSFSDRIGADAYVKYGTDAPYKARELLKSSKQKDLRDHLAAVLDAKCQERLKALLEVCPTFIDAAGNVILQGDGEPPGPCLQCPEWRQQQYIENAGIFSCPCGFIKIDATVILEGKALGKISFGPFAEGIASTGGGGFSHNRAGSTCPRINGPENEFAFQSMKAPPLKAEKMLLIIQAFSELVQEKIKEQQLQQQIEEQKESLIRSLKFQEELKNALNEANYRSLQSQVNPHFLFNSLNSLARMAMLEGAEQTEKLSYALARILRYILQNFKGTVTIAEEIKMLQDYLFIQQARFSDRLQIEFQLEEGIEKAHIPCLVLQPLVENAVLHGIEPLEGEGVLKICGRLEKQKIIFEIRDNGVGIPPSKLKEISQLNINSSGRGHTTGLGLAHVHQRLQHYFGADYGLEIESHENEGTLVRINFPYIHQGG
ncbi:MAG TPA: histidine kinase [Syntrophomonadaceae bacterium]|nr:histidine kinase [Syntrophomonadaceae bacterium]